VGQIGLIPKVGTHGLKTSNEEENLGLLAYGRQTRKRKERRGGRERKLAHRERWVKERAVLESKKRRIQHSQGC